MHVWMATRAHVPLSRAHGRGLGHDAAADLWVHVGSRVHTRNAHMIPHSCLPGAHGRGPGLCAAADTCTLTCAIMHDCVFANKSACAFFPGADGGGPEQGPAAGDLAGGAAGCGGGAGGCGRVRWGGMCTPHLDACILCLEVVGVVLAGVVTTVAHWAGMSCIWSNSIGYWIVATVRWCSTWVQEDTL